MLRVPPLLRADPAAEQPGLFCAPAYLCHVTDAHLLQAVNSSLSVARWRRLLAGRGISSLRARHPWPEARHPLSAAACLHRPHLAFPQG